MPSSFEYAVIRIVPRVEREEFFNAGVILFCLEKRFLKAAVHLDHARLRVLAAHLDLDELQNHLTALAKVAEGSSDSGPMANLSQRERFRWLVAPRSTIIQVSAVHAGLCDEPAQKLDQLFQDLVG